jgi:hypothetical protein
VRGAEGFLRGRCLWVPAALLSDRSITGVARCGGCARDSTATLRPRVVLRSDEVPDLLVSAWVGLLPAALNGPVGVVGDLDAGIAVGRPEGDDVGACRGVLLDDIPPKAGGRGASCPASMGVFSDQGRPTTSFGGRSDGGVNLQRGVFAVAFGWLALDADVELEPDRIGQVDQGLERRVGALAAQEP